MMRGRVQALIAAAAMGAVLALGARLALTAPDTALPWSVSGSGGTSTSASASYRLGATAGQPAIGQADSTGFRLGAGFWYADSDGDNVLDAADNCPLVATVWVVPPGDPDCDASTTVLENYVGTDPFDACGANAWPPDTDGGGVGNTVVNNLDILIILVHWLEVGPGLPYIVRPDIFDGNLTINNLDILPILSYWLKPCT